MGLTDPLGLIAVAKNGLGRISKMKHFGKCRQFIEQPANISGINADTLDSQIQRVAAEAQNYIYDGPSSETPLDESGFANTGLAGVKTVGEWFDQRSDEIALSQQNGYAIFLHSGKWAVWLSSLLSPYAKWDGTATNYGLGVLFHEILLKQMINGGFSHSQMKRALNAVKAPFPDYGSEPIADRIRQICFE